LGLLWYPFSLGLPVFSRHPFQRHQLLNFSLKVFSCGQVGSCIVYLFARCRIFFLPSRPCPGRKTLLFARILKSWFSGLPLYDLFPAHFSAIYPYSAQPPRAPDSPVLFRDVATPLPCNRLISRPSSEISVWTCLSILIVFPSFWSPPKPTSAYTPCQFDFLTTKIHPSGRLVP